MSAPPKGEMVDVGEYEVHCLRYGEGDPVVFLHGSGPGASGYSNFKGNIESIVRTGREVVLIDMIGFGYSSKPTNVDYTTELFSKTCVTALQKLGIDRFHLLGNSLGGAVAIQTALSNPDMVRSLVMMAPGGIEDMNVYQAMPGIAKMTELYMGGEFGHETLGNLLRMLVHKTDVVTDELIEERLAVFKTQPKEVLSRLIVRNMENELKDLKCPILGFWGQKDEFTPVGGATKFLDQCPGSQFTLIADCGHWVMIEHADLFNHYVGHFLEQLDS